MKLGEVTHEMGADVNGVPWQIWRIQRTDAPRGYVHVVETGAMHTAPRTHISRDGYAMCVEHWPEFGYAVSIDTRRKVR